MKRSHVTTLVPLICLLVLGLIAAHPASAQWKTQKTPAAVKDTDLAQSPSRGPSDAPVIMGVFSDFQ